MKIKRHLCRMYVLDRFLQRHIERGRQDQDNKAGSEGDSDGSNSSGGGNGDIRGAPLTEDEVNGRRQRGGNRASDPAMHDGGRRMGRGSVGAVARAALAQALLMTADRRGSQGSSLYVLKEQRIGRPRGKEGRGVILMCMYFCAHLRS